jgi:ABC-2 type transport system permease protein
MSEWGHATRHSLRSQQRQSVAWTAVIVVTGVATVRGYLSAYPTTIKRVLLARSIGSNVGFQALYGVARNISSVGGFTTWRLTWMLATLTGVWGLLASTRLVRGEEDSGRRELLLAGPISGAQLLASDLVAVALPLIACWAMFGAVLAVCGLATRGAFVLAGGIVAPGLLFGAVGALTSQLYPDRRHAMGIGGVVLGAAFLLRVAADGSTTLGWLRWATPLGWVENLQPFAGTRLLAAGPLLAATIVATGASFAFLARRDYATGLLSVRDRGKPGSPLLRTNLGFTVKLERVAIASWAAGIGAFAFVFGLLANDVAIFIRGQPQLQGTLTKLGVSSLGRPQDFLGLMFTFFALPIAIFAATQASAVREEEATGRLDALLVRPLGRRRWLFERCVVVASGAVVIAAVAGALAWSGAALRHSTVGWRPMLGAGLNCLPPTLLLFGLSVLCFGLAPRLTPAFALGSAVVAYLLELVGALVNAPSWLLDLSPFHHISPVPAAPANGVAAFVMVGLGVAGAAAGIACLAHRDLVGA